MEFTLVPYTEKYKEELIELYNQVDRTYLNTRLPYPLGEVAGEKWTEELEEKEGLSQLFRLVLVQDKAVGCIVVKVKQRECVPTGEIGYILLPSFEHRGLITKAIQEMCPKAFTELKIHRIVAYIYAPHTASRKVVERNGFRLEGVVIKSTHEEKEHEHDICIYGLMK